MKKLSNYRAVWNIFIPLLAATGVFSWLIFLLIKVESSQSIALIVAALVLLIIQLVSIGFVFGYKIGREEKQ